VRARAASSERTARRAAESRIRNAGPRCPCTSGSAAAPDGASRNPYPARPCPADACCVDMRRTEGARTAAMRRKVYSAAACSKAAVPTAMSATMSAATCGVTPAAAPPAAASAGICFEREKRDDEEQHRNASTGRQHRSC